MKNLAFSVFYIFLVLPIGCRSHSLAEEGGQEQNVTPVVVKKARTTDLHIVLDVTGTITAKRIVPVASEIGGRVAEVKVEEGDKVELGQVLIVLDDSDYKLQYERAELAYKMAEKQLEGLEKAAEIERQTLELSIKQAQAGMKQIQANLEKLEAGARPAEKASVAAAVHTARTQLEAMKREMSRLRKLYESQVIPKSQLDKVIDGYKVARCQYKAAVAKLTLIREGARKEDRQALKAALEQVETAVEMAKVAAKRSDVRSIDIEAAKLGVRQAKKSLSIAKRMLEKTEIRAPVAGIVELRKVEPGAVVGPGVNLLTLFVPESVELQIMITDVQRAKLTQNAWAEFEPDALEGKKFSGPVTFISSTPSPSTGAYIVRVKPRKGPIKLLAAGMLCKVRLYTGRVRENAVMIPLDSVLYREGMKVAFVNEDGTASLRKVQIGEAQNQWVEVLSGISAGEEVVVEGQLGLIEGAKISVTTKQEE